MRKSRALFSRPTRSTTEKDQETKLQVRYSSRQSKVAFKNFNQVRYVSIVAFRKQLIEGSIIVAYDWSKP